MSDIDAPLLRAEQYTINSKYVILVVYGDHGLMPERPAGVDEVWIVPPPLKLEFVTEEQMNDMGWYRRLEPRGSQEVTCPVCDGDGLDAMAVCGRCGGDGVVEEGAGWPLDADGKPVPAIDDAGTPDIR